MFFIQFQTKIAVSVSNQCTADGGVQIDFYSGVRRGSKVKKQLGLIFACRMLCFLLRFTFNGIWPLKHNVIVLHLHVGVACQGEGDVGGAF